MNRWAVGIRFFRLEYRLHIRLCFCGRTISFQKFFLIEFRHTEWGSKSVATLWTQRLLPHIPLSSINLCAAIVLGPPCRFELINIPKNMSLLLKYQTLNNLLCFGNAQQIIICIHHNCYLRLWIWKCCVEEVVFGFRTWCFSKFHFNLFNIIFRLWIFRFKRKT